MASRDSKKSPCKNPTATVNFNTCKPLQNRRPLHEKVETTGTKTSWIHIWNLYLEPSMRTLTWTRRNLWNLKTLKPLRLSIRFLLYLKSLNLHVETLSGTCQCLCASFMPLYDFMSTFMSLYLESLTFMVHLFCT